MTAAQKFDAAFRALALEARARVEFGTNQDGFCLVFPDGSVYDDDDMCNAAMGRDAANDLAVIYDAHKKNNNESKVK